MDESWTDSNLNRVSVIQFVNEPRAGEEEEEEELGAEKRVMGGLGVCQAERDAGPPPRDPPGPALAPCSSCRLAELPCHACLWKKGGDTGPMCLCCGGWGWGGGYVLLMRVEFPRRAIKQIFGGVGGGD